jgi:hypothetical protein
MYYIVTIPASQKWFHELNKILEEILWNLLPSDSEIHQKRWLEDGNTDASLNNVN